MEPTLLVVDGANVVGARPADRWWRDRAGAARRLHARLAAAVATGRLPGPVLLVLEGAARAGVPAQDDGAVQVAHAASAGDEEIVARVGAGARRTAVTVVTADRALAARVRAVGAAVVGPGWLWDRIGEDRLAEDRPTEVRPGGRPGRPRPDRR